MDISKIIKAVERRTGRMSCGAVIVAAGTASRMGGIDKVMAPLGGVPMIQRTVRTFQESDVIREIVIVTRQDLVTPIMELCRSFDKVTAVTVGGDGRQDSVEIGLSALSKNIRLAAIQDGARPLITQQVIARTVKAANACGAAAPAIPVKDTVKVVRDGVVTETPDRSTLRAVQTPQAFDVDLLKAALYKAREEGAAVTDDCSAVERLGMPVKIVEGDERNIKVTTPLDLKIAELLLEDAT
ncbi:MAG: 2-C-methyl-D-erythritol 4-phosphate cytidylyltransferase [Ruminococcaceae bacterium]|nr:2-C-methyl-D-erythritol 4-phosphate cytidylyltransferase [Oscillospiraceae bacterium]